MIINRYYGKNQTIGHLIYKDFKCFTIELPWLNNQSRISCIPEGEYTVIKHVSPKFGSCLWIQNVPDRSEILMHVGNYAGSLNPATGKSDLLGCIAPGLLLADINNDDTLDISQSKPAMDRILSLVPETFKLKIQ